MLDTNANTGSERRSSLRSLEPNGPHDARHHETTATPPLNAPLSNHELSNQAFADHDDGPSHDPPPAKLLVERHGLERRPRIRCCHRTLRRTRHHRRTCQYGGRSSRPRDPAHHRRLAFEAAGAYGHCRYCPGWLGVGQRPSEIPSSIANSLSRRAVAGCLRGSL